MSKIIIIDDEPLARSIVKEYLQKYPELEIVQECNDGFEGVKAIQKWKEQASSSQKNTNELLETASQSPAQSQRIVVKTGSKIKIIPVHDVHFLEAADDYVKVHTQEGSFLKNKTMNHFERTLDGQQFVRSHRSFIVNVQQITRIDPYEKDNHIAILKSGAKVPVSRNGYVKLRTVLGL